MQATHKKANFQKKIKQKRYSMQGNPQFFENFSDKMSLKIILLLLN